ncbi:uncharacterized protein LOC135849071 [Planococcus citri]|uniref:uncharacterized protein LOC135849071 n=1 Tax=Planococcus citri TaxID=170843 RepID=UPI0031F81E5D
MCAALLARPFDLSDPYTLRRMLFGAFGAPSHRGSMKRTVCSAAPLDVPDLREIAAVNIAIALWNHVNIPVALFRASSNTPAEFYGIENAAVESTTSKWNRVISEVCELSDKLPVPNSVANNIKQIVSTVGDRVVEWVSYHRRTVFFGAGDVDHLYYHVSYFAWYSDGTINNEQTARNLLSSLRLSFVEKYRLLCTYCLKDEIEEMAPQLLKNNVQEIVEFTSYPLIYYWDRYFRNQLHIVPTRNTSLDSSMFRHAAVDNWPAKKYFFDRLSSEEKIQNAIQLIDTRGIEYQRLLFTRLSEFERMHVYMQRAERIVINYMNMESSKYILPVWFEMRFLITAEQFSSIFYTLLKTCLAPNMLIIASLNAQKQNHFLESILKEIWASAGDDFRNHLIVYNDYKIFELLSENIDDNNDLLFTILRNVNASDKKKIVSLPFFNSYCDKLLAKDDIQDFNRLLNVFLPHGQDADQFREEIVFRSTYIGYQCVRFYSVGNVNAVNEMLGKLLPTANSVVFREFKKNVLSSPDRIGRCVDYGILNLDENAMNAVIADCFLLKYQITKFKRNLVISSSAIKKFQELICVGNITKTKYYVENYLTSEKDKKTLKKQLVAFDSPVSSIVTMFTWCELEHIQSLLEWCLEDDNAIREFKSALPVDDIFNEMLKQAIFLEYDDFTHRLSNCSFKGADSFEEEIEAMNRFLYWYFDSYHQIKQYKLRRIHSYNNNLQVIKTLLKKKNDVYLRTTLKWFFDNDAAEIQKFRYTQKGKITNIPF